MKLVNESKSYGTYEGEICGRSNCTHKISRVDDKNCSCHINPPCSNCTDAIYECFKCGWNSEDDVIANKAYIPKTFHVFLPQQQRELDPSKIDYHIKSHTHFSQICEGVYPENTTKEQVLERVQGTFGGRFDFFGEGKFRYIAYTD